MPADDAHGYFGLIGQLKALISPGPGLVRALVTQEVLRVLVRAHGNWCRQHRRTRFPFLLSPVPPGNSERLSSGVISGNYLRQSIHCRIIHVRRIRQSKNATYNLSPSSKSSLYLPDLRPCKIHCFKFSERRRTSRSSTRDAYSSRGFPPDSSHAPRPSTKRVLLQRWSPRARPVYGRRRACHRRTSEKSLHVSSVKYEHSRILVRFWLGCAHWAQIWLR
jgi:hypothetical protein